MKLASVLPFMTHPPRLGPSACVNAWAKANHCADTHVRVRHLQSHLHLCSGPDHLMIPAQPLGPGTSSKARTNAQIRCLEQVFRRWGQVSAMAFCKRCGCKIDCIFVCTCAGDRGCDRACDIAGGGKSALSHTCNIFVHHFYPCAWIISLLLPPDDIHLNNEMERWWRSIKYPKHDITAIGHRTGINLSSESVSLYATALAEQFIASAALILVLVVHFPNCSITLLFASCFLVACFPRTQSLDFESI